MSLEIFCFTTIFDRELVTRSYKRLFFFKILPTSFSSQFHFSSFFLEVHFRHIFIFPVFLWNSNFLKITIHPLIPLPFITITLHYHLLPLPFITITLITIHYHYPPLPFITITLHYHYPSLPLPLPFIIILYHSVPLPFSTITIQYHSLPFSTITITLHYH